MKHSPKDFASLVKAGMPRPWADHYAALMPTLLGKSWSFGVVSDVIYVEMSNGWWAYIIEAEVKAFHQPQFTIGSGAPIWEGEEPPTPTGKTIRHSDLRVA